MESVRRGISARRLLITPMNRTAGGATMDCRRCRSSGWRAISPAAMRRIAGPIVAFDNERSPIARGTQGGVPSASCTVMNSNGVPRIADVPGGIGSTFGEQQRQHRRRMRAERAQQLGDRHAIGSGTGGKLQQRARDPAVVLHAGANRCGALAGQRACTYRPGAASCGANPCAAAPIAGGATRPLEWRGSQALHSVHQEPDSKVVAASH